MWLSLRKITALLVFSCGLGMLPTGGVAQTVSPDLFSSIRPSSQSVELGTTATVFGALVNGGSTPIDDCRIALPANAPAGLVLHYQTTDPTTNLPIGTPDTPVTVPGNNGVQTFILSFTGTAGEPFDVAAFAPSFVCGAGDSALTAAVFPGYGTLDLAMSTTPVPDIIAATGTSGNQDIVTMPYNGAGAFAVAGINLGVAGPITVSVDTSSIRFPVAAIICETASDTGQCLAAPAATVSLDYQGGTVNTFSVFLQATGGSPVVLLTDEAFVNFTDAQGLLRGTTSVTVSATSDDG